jgi:hypothetical protein
MEKPKVIPVEGNQELLIDLYKRVFSGHPWHEDLICKNAQRELDDPKKCMVQYTRQFCERYDTDKASGKPKNDCRESYVKRLDVASREGIVLLEGALERCVGCGEKLELIEFYPDFVDHRALIDEAVNERGFIGNMLVCHGNPIGFGWGYTVPRQKTKSVNFPLVIPLLGESGLTPEKTFYDAELGIESAFQNEGFGSSITALKIAEAHRKGHEAYCGRTINPFVHSILERVFSGRKGELLFKDPERGSSWFKWDFKDFDPKYVEKVSDRVSI